MEYCKKCTYILLDKCSTQESVKNWATENGSQWIGWKRGLMETIMSFIFFHLSSSFFSFFFIFFQFSFNFSHFLSFFHFKTCPHFLRTVCIPTFVFIFMCYIHFNTKIWIWRPYISKTGLNVDRFDFVIKRVPHPPEK